MKNNDQNAKKIYNINEIGMANFHGDVIIYKNDKKIKKHLGTIPTFPELFIGRENEVETVHERLKNNKNILLLVNGAGGIGKTTLASKYYYQYKDYYQHLVWVFSGTSIIDALLTLAMPLGVEFPPKMPNEERFSVLLQAMAELNEPCLLIIDNANEVAAIEKYYGALLQCTNFHILLTTRVNKKLHNTEIYKVKPLEPKDALQLFIKHYEAHDSSENDLFFSIYEAVNRNTLVVELLAKNLANFNNDLEQDYSLSRLLENINDSLLKLDKSEAVGTFYHAKNGIQRKETPENIIAAMYDLSRLNEIEKRLLSIFSVLPAESIPYATLKDLVTQDRLSNHLFGLFEKGWLDYDKNGRSFRMSPVVQEVVLLKSENLYSDCEEMIEVLISKLEYKGKHLIEITYELAIELSRYSENIIKRLGNNEKYEIANLSKFIGNYYSIIGNLNKSLLYLNISQSIFSKLTNNNLDNKKFKDGLANSYEGLGTLFSNLGDLSLALNYFIKYNLISNELYNNNLNDKNCKNNLAVSFEKLGSIYSELGNYTVALESFERYNQLEKDLYNTYPNNTGIKNNLATSHESLGTIYSVLGDLDKTLNHFKKQSQLLKELYDEEPSSVPFKNNFSGSYEKLGSVYSTLGDFNKALYFFKEGNRLKKELYGKNPNIIDLKNGLAISNHNLGNIHVSLNKQEVALDIFKDMLKLYEELYDSYPNNVNYKNGLAVSHQNLGIVHSDLGDLKSALPNFENYYQLTKELHNKYLDNVNYKNSLAISYQYLGIVHSNLGDLKSALPNFENYYQSAKELYNKYPDNIGFKENLAISCEKIGLTHSKLGNLHLGLKFFIKNNQLEEELYNAYPNNINYANGFAVSYERLGKSHLALGNMNMSLEHLEKYNQLSNELHIAHSNNVKLKNGLAVSYENLGWFYSNGRVDITKAKANYNLSRKVFLELIESYPNETELKRSLNHIVNALKRLS